MAQTDFSQASLRVLSALRKKTSFGYELLRPLGFNEAKELAEAMTPLVDAGLVRFAGSPYTDTGLLEANYAVPPSRAAYVDQLLYFNPLKLSDAPTPPDNKLSRDSLIILEKLLALSSDGYVLMNAISTRDPKKLADALNPLTEKGLVAYSGQPFTDDGLSNAQYYVPPSQQGYARVVLKFNPTPKLGSPATP